MLTRLPAGSGSPTARGGSAEGQAASACFHGLPTVDVQAKGTWSVLHCSQNRPVVLELKGKCWKKARTELLSTESAFPWLLSFSPR